MQTTRRKFSHQRHTAKERGIEWALTYDEWLFWWEQTGHFHERGCRRGQYVMARIGDVGPYSLENILCLRIDQNSVLPVHSSHPGEAHPRARLTWEQVRAIRESELLYRDLATLYGVSRSMIRKIRAGSRWKETDKTV
jgi:hypothetical protein